MRKLIAQNYLLLAGKDYWPGDTLPDDRPRAEELVENGAARWVSEAPPTQKATLTTALPGLPGSAVGGSESENLVNRVPKRRNK